MQSTRPVNWLLVLCAVVCTLVVAAGHANSTSSNTIKADRTIWDRVYTTEQAARGEMGAWNHCFQCHSISEWGSARFIQEWQTRRVGDLYNTIKRSMPEDDPGKLSAEEYADIIAYMLKLNNAPAGDAELPTNLEILDKILIRPAPPKG